MKRMIAYILTAILLFSLAGCKKEAQTLQEPVNFYYLRNEMTYGSEDSVVLAESRESAGHRDDPMYLLSEYLKGPKTEDCIMPFPAGTTLQALSVENEIARLTLSDPLSQLTGMDLSIACACLTLTAIELTGARTVEIRTETTLLNGAPYISMDKNSLLLLDDTAI